MKPYSMDLRERVVAKRDEGMQTSEVVELFECSAAWVRRLMQRRRERGSIEPIRRKQVDQRKLKDDDEATICRLVMAKPDITLAELAAELDHKASCPTISRTLTKLGLPRKKSPRTPLSRTGQT